jgi:hypothetical protein
MVSKVENRVWILILEGTKNVTVRKADSKTRRQFLGGLSEQNSRILQ